MKRVSHLIGTGLFIASLIFVGKYFSEHWTGNVRFPLGSVVISGALYAITHLTTTIAWIWIVKATGNTIPIREGFAINLVSQAGKYIPGNIAHHLGRAALAKQAGVSLKASSIVLPIEVACVCFAALLVGGFMISHWITAACLVGLIGMLVTPGRRFVLPIMALAAGLLLAGLSFAILVDAPKAISAYPIAWLAGFLLPGAPAGLGVREAALLTLLDHSVSSGSLPAAIIFHRLITAAIDGLVAIVAYFAALASIQRRAENRGPTTGK
jgi:uncharacterized membrane protein YbhN (UPF0104 family)